ncbi:MAG: iron-sulfur cluster assembly accessory protein [Candidatus Omnitrophota bacterium]|nr:iron-sulfur cluster assembly accessory protein [Candidatus Omnitrophota bacterium]MDZ4241980.1 iron-sulfur cluster assembly accessory protein [Candidatus Omnitrophota bacterium]
MVDRPQANTSASSGPQPLITLTQAAATKILSMMDKEEKPGYALRLGVVPGGCAGLSYDMRFQKTPYDNDLIFEQHGIKVIINPESAALLKQTEIDYVDTLKDSGFKYRNPNAKSSCGCGTSFS